MAGRSTKSLDVLAPDKSPFKRVFSSLATAYSKNTAIISQELPEQNAKYMNEYFITFSKSGKDSLEDHYQDILSIAQQCPYEGGPSVYKARIFVSLFNDTIEYDDEGTCLQGGIYRETLSEKTFSEIEAVSIVPNPANDYIKIYVESSSKGICRINIFNSIGDLVIFDSMNCQDKIKNIHTNQLKPGVYSIKVVIDESTIKQAKFVITR